MSPCARYCLLISSQLTTWSQGNLHYIRLRVTNYGLHFFQLDRDFFCLLQPSLARLYSATASPSELLRSDGSLAMNTFCFFTMRAALFLSQTICAIKCCIRWEVICFLSRLQLFPEEFGVDGQNYVVLRVIVGHPPQICICPSHPLSIERCQQRLRLYG